MIATINIEPSVSNVHVAMFDIGSTVWQAAKEAEAQGKPFLWFNSRIWIVTGTGWVFETDANFFTLPADLAGDLDDIYYERVQ